MTIKQANEIKDLLARRDELINEKRAFDECSQIRAEIVVANEVIPVAWLKNHKIIKYIIAGIAEEIRVIEKKLENIRVIPYESDIVEEG